MLSRGTTLFLHVHQPRSAPNPILLGFYGHDWLNYWPVVIELNIQPLPPPQRSEGEVESQPSNHLVGSPGNQPPLLGAFQRPPC